MNKFYIEFLGRPNFALGNRSKYKEVIEADTLDTAVLKLYERFEQVFVLFSMIIKEK